MLRFILCVFIAFAYTCVPQLFADLPLEDLIEGVNQTRHTIESGEIQNIMTMEHPAKKTEVEIRTWLQSEKESRLKEFTPDPLYPDVDARKYEKEFLIPALESETYWMRKRLETGHTNTTFQILQESGGIPTLYKYKLTHVGEPDYTLDDKLPFYPGSLTVLVYDTQTQVTQKIGDLLFIGHEPATLSDSGGFSWHFWHYSLFGRAPATVPENAQHLGREVIDGVECHKIAFTSKNKRNFLIWVDPVLDFCVRRVDYMNRDDKSRVSARRTYKEFKKFGEVWFPVFTESVVFKKDGSINYRHTIKVVDAEFNVDFPKDFFKVNKTFFRSKDEPPSMGFLPDVEDPFSVTAPESDNPLLLCGPQSLLRVCELLNVPTHLEELQKLSSFSPLRGTTLLGLKEAGNYKGLSTTGVKGSVELLRRKKVPMPAIAYVDFNHFLVFESVNKSGVTITDPADKYESPLTWDKLSEIWSGELLIFDKKKGHRGNLKQVPLAFTESPTFDFGKVIGGSKIKHTFSIKNIGQKDLKIISVTETCACTASVPTRSEILPGKTGKISVILTVPDSNGTIEENIFVLTDDPIQNTLVLTLKGEAFTPLKTFPQNVAFGTQLPLKTPVTKRVSLHAQEHTHIQGVRIDTEHITATLKNKEGIPHVDVRLLTTLPIGKFVHNIHIDYEYKGQQTVYTIPVFGEILSDLRVVPKRLFLGLIKDVASVSKTITISSRNKQPFEIRAVKTDTQFVSVTFKKDESETAYKVTMTLSPQIKSGNVSGDIVIQTSSSVHSSILVPFFGVIATPNGK